MINDNFVNVLHDTWKAYIHTHANQPIQETKRSQIDRKCVENKKIQMQVLLLNIWSNINSLGISVN